MRNMYNDFQGRKLCPVEMTPVISGEKKKHSRKATQSRFPKVAFIKKREHNSTRVSSHFNLTADWLINIRLTFQYKKDVNYKRDRFQLHKAG